MLDHIEGAGYAVGRQQRRPRTHGCRLGCRQELALRAHEAWPHSVGRLVERDRQRVGGLLGIESEPHRSGDRGRSAVDRGPELAVVGTEEERRSKASSHLVCRNLSDQRPLRVSRKRSGSRHRRVAGVPHEQVVVPVMGDRSRRRAIDLADRALRSNSGKRRSSLLSRGTTGGNAKRLQLSPLTDGRGQIVNPKPYRPLGNLLADGHVLDALTNAEKAIPVGVERLVLFGRPRPSVSRIRLSKKLSGTPTGIASTPRPSFHRGRAAAPSARPATAPPPRNAGRRRQPSISSSSETIARFQLIRVGELGRPLATALARRPVLHREELAHLGDPLAHRLRRDPVLLVVGELDRPAAVVVADRGARRGRTYRGRRTSAPGR